VKGKKNQPGVSRNSAAENRRGPERDPFRVYGVNVILAHNSEDNSPVIFETTPSFANLFWHHSSVPTTHAAAGPAIFMDLRGGSLLPRRRRAFLVMYAIEALSRTGCLARTETHAQSQSPGNSAA